VLIVAFGRREKVALVKAQIIVITLVLVAGGASLSALPQWPAISKQQVATAEIDFTVLHRQASDALDIFRRSQERRRVGISPAAF
jgi:hypothetical protein